MVGWFCLHRVVVCEYLLDLMVMTRTCVLLGWVNVLRDPKIKSILSVKYCVHLDITKREAIQDVV